MSDKLNIAQTLIDEPKFAIFVKGLIMTGLIDKVSRNGPFTILAPSNVAFMTLPEARLMELMQPINKENLAEVMKYHIIEGKFMSDELALCTTVISFQNQWLQIEASSFGFRVNGVNVQARNIEVSNGVIHGINAVLFPAIATGVF
jgi:uncharacterized surface protein with fasciclin (FAS1) repeats